MLDFKQRVYSEKSKDTDLVFPDLYNILLQVQDTCYLIIKVSFLKLFNLRLINAGAWFEKISIDI